MRPNANINEIKNKASDVRYFPYGPRPSLRKYEKGNWLYTYDVTPLGGEEINAMYKPTEQMFSYNFKTKKWNKIHYIKGGR